MVSCTKCEAKAVKRDNKEGRYYVCVRHGFLRDIVPIGQTLEELKEELVNGN